MCAFDPDRNHSNIRSIFYYSTAILLAFCFNYFNYKPALLLADSIASGVVFCFKWCSIPMIALAILSSASSLGDKKVFFTLGKNVIKYTIFTTVIAATIALLLFLLFNPTNLDLPNIIDTNKVEQASGNFGLISICTMFSSVLFSLVIVSLPNHLRHCIGLNITKAYTVLMRLIQRLLKLMPIAIWAFITLFIQDVNSLMIKTILLYLACILTANLVQACIVLPMLLKVNNINIIDYLKAMAPALNVAFWSKSSGVALPVAVNCAIKRANLSEEISKFAFPICTTINMNACSAFILITVLFVSTSYGIVYSPLMLVAWIGIATLAAIGNAGVPMGCFTLSMALLAYMEIPLQVMGLILPFYAIIDMLESAINVWSDACVTAIVDKKFSHSVLYSKS